MRHPELAILSHHTTIFTTDARFAVHIFPRSGVVELRIHKVVVALNFSPFFLPLLNFLFMLPPPFLPYFCPWILTALAALYLPWLGSDGVEFRAFQTKPTWPTFLTHPPDLLIHHGGLNTEKIKRQNIYQSKKSGAVWSLHWRLKCFLGCMEAFDKCFLGCIFQTVFFTAVHCIKMCCVALPLASLLCSFNRFCNMIFLHLHLPFSPHSPLTFVSISKVKNATCELSGWASFLVRHVIAGWLGRCRSLWVPGRKKKRTGDLLEISREKDSLLWISKLFSCPGSSIPTLGQWLYYGLRLEIEGIREVQK